MIYMLLMVPGVARATASFDATAPAAEFTGQETYDQPGEIKLWSRVERIEDPDRTLFTQESFNQELAWPETAEWAPWIADCFGSTTPHSSSALLHMGVSESVASGTPILLIPGAGDNGVRAYVTMGSRLDRGLRPVYALTFAHAHGDVFQQAEIVANAIARIKERTGAAQVDLVAHSKGGVAAAVYLSNDGSPWGQPAYDRVGTTYRGDVRRAVFVATPLGGIDTAFRWSSMNLYGLEGETALSPTSWTTWYPYTTANPYVTESMLDQHIGGGGADYFPGHRQLLARWDDEYELPGAQSWLGAYALQPDWYTTYEGGLGFQSGSDGIDASIEAGGGLIAALHGRGVDPGVELFLLAGQNPLMPNGTEDWMAESFDSNWVELAGEAADVWSIFVADLVASGLKDLGVTEGEVQGLAGGDLVLGEITGPSDGLVFVDSATDAAALTGRGAVVMESRVVNLSHIDLLYASDITGELLIESAGDDPANAWAVAVGERYVEANTLAWVEEVLADAGGGTDTGDGGGADGGASDGGSSDGGTGDGGSSDDTGTAGDGGGDHSDDTGGPSADEGGAGGCGRCSGLPAPALAGWGLALAGLAATRRRR